MKKFLNEFKEFINRGNVMDLAVGVIIGGAFISACINFLIVAFVVFLLVKAVNKAQNLGEKLAGKEEEAPAAVPTCPFCLEEVKEGATRCPHCAGQFDAPIKAE